MSNNMTREQIEKEIKFHKKQIAGGRVGTPNVYVRLTDLERTLKTLSSETVLQVIISTKRRPLIDKVKDAINNALLDLENRGNVVYWDIQEVTE